MLVLSVNVFGEEQLKRALSRWAEYVQDYTPALIKIREDFYSTERWQFSEEGARTGAPWRKLSPRYAAWKARYYPGKPILQLTGELEATMGHGLGMVVEMTPKMLRMHPMTPKAMWHQRGTFRMPARPVVVLIEEDKRRWTKIIHEYVFDTARSQGLV